MSQFELGLSPAGFLFAYLAEPESDTVAPAAQSYLTAFRDNACRALFLLLQFPSELSLSPTVRYWQGFVERYLHQRCSLPRTDTLLPVPPLPEEEVAALLAQKPLMRGAEYLNADCLTHLYEALDDWVCQQLREQDGLDAFLQQYAPHWHQAGRVCFHLAENKIDPDYPFAFMATYSPTLVSGKARYLPLQQALKQYAGQENKQQLIKLLSPVQLAAESVDWVQELVETGDIYSPLAWRPEEAYLMLKQAPVLEQCGIVLRLPDWWKKKPKAQVSVTIGQNKKKKFGAQALFEFNMGVAVGGEALTEEEMAQIRQAQSGLMFLKGQWVEVDAEKVEQALQHWETVARHASGDGLSFIESMRLLAGADLDLKQVPDEQTQQWSFVQADQWLQEQLALIRSPEAMATRQPGRALHATLRPYQQHGLNWLHGLTQLGLGACLADDMGLGKTIQIISLLLIEKKKLTQQPALLVLPASLLNNWRAELEKFAPSLKGLFLHSSVHSKQALARMALAPQETLKQVHVVLTTYTMLSRQAWLQEQDWHLVVLDEAQAIKNPGAQQTKAVKKLKAKARIALTGTPVENRIGDLWSLFDFLNPGLLGTASRFKQFNKQLQSRKNDQYGPMRCLISPYILRRMKTDKSIISDLPDKTELAAYCGLSKVQAVQYQQAVTELRQALESKMDGIEKKGVVLSYLLRFKQICNHPSQLTGGDDFAARHSGKFQRLAGICEEIASRQEKVLVFTQFQEMTQPLAEYLQTLFGESGLVLHGGTRIAQRKKYVEQFQQPDGPPFFVLSLKAGGTGLTLTQASHVIHFDRWWNPAVENQATDRAFRIGQKNNVLVHKMICQGTIEEKIDRLLQDKQELANDLLGNPSETLLTEMDNQQIIDLVTLDIDSASI